MPRVTVVLPAYFSHATLPESLAALAAQDRPPDEVIVVNSSGDVETPAVVAAWPGVRLIDSPVRLYPHAARNVGLAEATGDILVCTDPDCRPDPAWLRELVTEVQAGRAVVGGAMDICREVADPAAKLPLAIHLTKFWWALPGRPAGPAWIAPTANLAFSRAAWQRAGPFRGDIFCGDAVQSWRFAAIGCPPWFTPRARVSHRHSESLATARRQRFIRGREFGRERAAWEGWGRGRRVCEAMAAPLRLAAVLWAARRGCAAAGWAAEFRRTAGMQSLLQAAWVAGETAGWLAGGKAMAQSVEREGKPDGRRLFQR
jgi:GT2 family glycosyltransferase